nr:MAG TPA: hypothetical protein [Caudoviricetes sp.]
MLIIFIFSSLSRFYNLLVNFFNFLCENSLLIFWKL